LSRGIGINLDGYLGAIVAVFIVISGLKLVSETSSPLLGTAPDKELVDAIYAKILSYEGILGIHDLAVHNYGGGNIFASVHCEVPSRDVKEDLGIDLVVHMDPVDVDDEKTCALRQTVAELLREISPQIGMHDFRVVWGISRTTLIFDVEVPYDFPMADGELLDEIQARLKALNPGYRGIITVDHDYVPRLPEQREKEGEKQ